MFGAATAVGVALITQIGEQVDFLRFHAGRPPANRKRWHFGVLLAGPWLDLARHRQDAGRRAAGLSRHQQRGSAG
jgi:hypothetical protein